MGPQLLRGPWTVLAVLRLSQDGAAAGGGAVATVSASEFLCSTRARAVESDAPRQWAPAGVRRRRRR